MNPSVNSLVLSAVEWDELCPWLLFRKCLRIAFSFRLLLLVTLHLLISALWINFAFQLQGTNTSVTVLDFLRENAPMNSRQFVPQSQKSMSMHDFLREDALPGEQSVFHESGTSESTGKMSDLEIVLANQNADISTQTSTPEAPKAAAVGQAVKQTPEPSSARADSAAAQTKSQSNTSAAGTSCPLCTSCWGVLLNRIFSISYAVFGTLFLWLAIARFTAVRLTRDFRESFRDTFTFSKTKLATVLIGALFLIGGAVLLSLPLWCGRFLPGTLSVCAAPLGLIYAVFYFFFLLGSGLGFLFIPSVLVTENSDVFDALSRGFAYALQRPLRFTFYVFAALFFGLLGLTAMGLFVSLILKLYVFLAISTPEFSPWIELQIFAFTWTIYAFLLLYGFSAIEGLYLLLRRDVDAVELETVWLTDPQGVPTPRLPELKSAIREANENAAGQ